MTADPIQWWVCCFLFHFKFLLVNKIKLIMGRIIVILLIHIIGDYFFQGNKLSKSKTSSFFHFLQHVVIYTLFFIVLNPL